MCCLSTNSTISNVCRIKNHLLTKTFFPQRQAQDIHFSWRVNKMVDFCHMQETQGTI